MPTPTTRTEPPAERPAWNVLECVAFRVGALYFVAYALFNGNVAALPTVLVASHGRVPGDSNGHVTLRQSDATKLETPLRRDVRWLNDGPE